MLEKSRGRTLNGKIGYVNKSHMLLVVLFMIGTITGCASATIQKRNQIEVGSSKKEVITLLGEPDSIERNQECEVLQYEADNWWKGTEAFCVFLSKGKVAGTSKYCSCYQQNGNVNTHFIIPL